MIHIERYLRVNSSGGIMSHIKLIQLSNNDRMKVLDKLGYSVNENGFIIDRIGRKEVICRYSNETVHINNAAIMPGSLVIMNANPLTMAEYFAKHE
jgi:hypothetical protein